MIVTLVFADVMEAAGHRLAEAVSSIDGSQLLISGAVAAITTGTAGMIYLICQDWVKARRDKKMIKKDRNDKIHAMLLDIIVNGLEDAMSKKKLSIQEGSQLYQHLQKKLGLNDLIPKERLLSITKKELKAARKKREIIPEKKPNIPGGPPTPVTIDKGKLKTMGRAARFFGRKAA